MRTSTIAVAAALTLGLSACSGGDDPTPEPPTTAPAPDAAAPTTTEPDDVAMTITPAPDAQDAPHPVLADPGPPPGAWEGVSQEASWAYEVDRDVVATGDLVLAPAEVDADGVRLVGYGTSDGTVALDVQLPAPEGVQVEPSSVALTGFGPDHVLVRWSGTTGSVHDLTDGALTAQVEAPGLDPVDQDVVGDALLVVPGQYSGRLVVHPGGVVETDATGGVLVHEGRVVEVDEQAVAEVSSLGMWHLVQATEDAAVVVGVDNVDFRRVIHAAPVDPATGEVGEVTRCTTADQVGLPVLSAGATWLQHGTARVELATGDVECLDVAAGTPEVVGDDGSSWVRVDGGVASVAPGETVPGASVPADALPAAVTEGAVVFAPHGVDYQGPRSMASYPRQG